MNLKQRDGGKDETMILTVEIQDPQFRPGDVVEFKHEYGSLFLWIHSWTSSGTWAAGATHEKPDPEVVAWHGAVAWIAKGEETVPVGAGYYTCAVQAGSRYQHPDADLMRPGMVQVFRQDRLDGHAVKVEWSGEIVSCDTPDNYFDREEDWKGQA